MLITISLYRTAYDRTLSKQTKARKDTDKRAITNKSVIRKVN